MPAEPRPYFGHDLGVALVDFGIGQCAVRCSVHHAKSETRVRRGNAFTNEAIEERDLLGQLAGRSANRRFEIARGNVVADDDRDVAERRRKARQGRERRGPDPERSQRFEVELDDHDAFADVEGVGDSRMDRPEGADAARLEVDGEQLLHWVTLHEMTHAVQFGSVPWLRLHLASLVREVVDTLEVKLDTSNGLRLPSLDDLRSTVESVRRGELVTLVIGRERR
ncbi:MAG: zinc-dependent metalloprotease, partial [Polyangiaceae bacterium]